MYLSSQKQHWGCKNSLSSTLMTEQDYYTNSFRLLKISDGIKRSNGILEADIIMRTRTNKEENFLSSYISTLLRFMKQMMVT